MPFDDLHQSPRIIVAIGPADDLPWSRIADKKGSAEIDSEWVLSNDDYLYCQRKWGCFVLIGHAVKKKLETDRRRIQKLIEKITKARSDAEFAILQHRDWIAPGKGLHAVAIVGRNDESYGFVKEYYFRLTENLFAGLWAAIVKEARDREVAPLRTLSLRLLEVSQFARLNSDLPTIGFPVAELSELLTKVRLAFRTVCKHEVTEATMLSVEVIAAIDLALTSWQETATLLSGGAGAFDLEARLRSMVIEAVGLRNTVSEHLRRAFSG